MRRRQGRRKRERRGVEPAAPRLARARRLRAPDRPSFSLGAFILPGCCLPDNTCGLSTDESYSTLEYLAGGASFPFTQPECVSAEVLNQQLRDSVVLAGFGRTTATGTCDHAALAAELPPE